MLATLLADDEALFEAAAAKYLSSVEISDEKVVRNPLLYAKVSKDGTKRMA